MSHLNRLIREHDVDVIYLAGPGHGGPALLANVYLEGTYSEIYPEVTQDAAGLRRLFRQFSTPGGVPSHVSVADARARSTRAASSATCSRMPSARPSTTPNCWSSRWSATARRRRVRSTGSWKGDELPQPGPRRRGAPDPAPERLQDRRPHRARPRTSDDDLRAFSTGTATSRSSSRATIPRAMHQAFAAALDDCYARIRAIQQDARAQRRRTIGRAGPPSCCARRKAGPGRRGRGRHAGRGHLPRPPGAAGATCATTPTHLAHARGVDAQYRPETLFDADGRLVPELAALAPRGRHAGWAPTRTPTAGSCSWTSTCPTSATTRSPVAAPASALHESTRQLGKLHARHLHAQPGAAELPALLPRRDATPTGSDDVFEVEKRCFVGRTLGDRRPPRAGRPRAWRC